MRGLKIALLQMTAHGTDLAANLAKGETFCRRAAAVGAGVALFPVRSSTNAY
jgi:predicted amidohydrolase